MLSKQRIRGNIGENRAEKFLKSRGYKIVERNYFNNFGEIDIICKKGNDIHFVEVKSSFTYFEPEQNMTGRKMTKILKAANKYLLDNNISEFSIFFDLVSVNFKKGRVSIYPNINTDFN